MGTSMAKLRLFFACPRAGDQNPGDDPKHAALVHQGMLYFRLLFV